MSPKAEFISFNGDWVKDCGRCGKAYGAGSMDGLKEFFFSSKKYLDGLEYRCKSCCREKDRHRTSGHSSVRKMRSPEKHKATTAVNNAIAAGRLKKNPCRNCGSLKVQGHHPDYSKPLDVIWLCSRHHFDEHQRMKKNG